MRVVVVMSNTNVKEQIDVDAEVLDARTRLARMRRRSLNLPLAKIEDNPRTRRIIERNRAIERYLKRKH